MTELLAVIIMAVVVMALLPPMGRTNRRHDGPTIANIRLNGLYKSFNIYSIDNNEFFPIYKSDNPAGPATGFREGDRATGKGAVLENNITAPLWVMVQDGSVSTKNYIHPSTGDVEDPLTVSATDATPAPLNLTFDFLERKNLSYSVMNMYDPLVGANWGPNTNADWVMMADNNANDYAGKPGRHTLGKGATQADINLAENSPNARFEGQSVLYGDGHVAFESTPFVGPGGDNIYAVATAKGNEPPTVTSKAGNKDDVALIPLSGNGGGAGSLSGLALDLKPRGPRPYWPGGKRPFDWVGLSRVVGVAMVVLATMVVLAVLRKRREAKAFED